MSTCTLFEALATLPDPRSRHGQIHPLSAVLGLVAGPCSWGGPLSSASPASGGSTASPLAHALGFKRGKTPSASTLSRTLRRFDAAQLEAILARWVGGRIDPDAFEQISLDGKPLRGSRDGEVPGQHLVAADAHEGSAVLNQIRVDAKTNVPTRRITLLTGRLSWMASVYFLGGCHDVRLVPALRF